MHLTISKVCGVKLHVVIPTLALALVIAKENKYIRSCIFLGRISLFLSTVKEIEIEKMEALKKLGNEHEKPYRGFTKLAFGYHEIVNFRTVKNKYAKSESDPKKTIVVELEKEVLFLPSYFWQKIDDTDIVDLNTLIGEGGKVYLYFGGRQKEGG